jgi:hypothetical protein
VIQGVQNLGLGILLRDEIPDSVIDLRDCGSKRRQNTVILNQLDILQWSAHKIRREAE